LDERKVKEVCNLLDNGAAHSKYYGTNIPKKLQMKYIEIIVGDTGQGVPQKELKNIFLPFYTTKPNNIGVGLSITKRIIEEHEGFIYFLTQEKKGSKVHILLPAQDTE
jgi:signal transduction histidine kinase